MRRDLHASSAFTRAMKRLVRKNRQAFASIRATLEMLQHDAFDARLASHKLKGDLAGLWACSAGYDLRIVFEIVKRDDLEIILLVSVGTHDEVYGLSSSAVAERFMSEQHEASGARATRTSRATRRHPFAPSLASLRACRPSTLHPCGPALQE